MLLYTTLVHLDNTNNLTHTSVGQIDNKSPKIFPNPSRGIFNLESDQIESIYIMQLNGQIIKILPGIFNQFDLGGVQDGYYVCSILFKNGLINNQVIHKIH